MLVTVTYFTFACAVDMLCCSISVCCIVVKNMRFAKAIVGARWPATHQCRLSCSSYAPNVVQSIYLATFLEE
jgi:hypothetical protein